MTTQPRSWDQWVERACAALDLDPRDVDIPLLHELSKNVSHDVTRPLAPVSTYILGLAVGQALGRGEKVDLDAQRALFDQIPQTRAAAGLGPSDD